MLVELPKKTHSVPDAVASDQGQVVQAPLPDHGVESDQLDDAPAESNAEEGGVSEGKLDVSAPAPPSTNEPRESADEAHLDADLAITLGRPKTAVKPMGNLSTMLKGRSMLSVSEASAEAEDQELADTSHLNGTYDEETVKAAWTALVQFMRGQNKVGLAATLANGEFAFLDPAIVFTVANEVQYEELKECATELLHYVRTRAGNGQLSLEVKVSEGEAPAVFLTPKDRYVKWASENPALETLRKRLDLDLG